MIVPEGWTQRPGATTLLRADGLVQVSASGLPFGGWRLAVRRTTADRWVQLSGTRRTLREATEEGAAWQPS